MAKSSCICTERATRSQGIRTGDDDVQKRSEQGARERNVVFAKCREKKQKGEREERIISGRAQSTSGIGWRGQEEGGA